MEEKKIETKQKSNIKNNLLKIGGFAVAVAVAVLTKGKSKPNA